MQEKKSDFGAFALLFTILFVLPTAANARRPGPAVTSKQIYIDKYYELDNYENEKIYIYLPNSDQKISNIINGKTTHIFQNHVGSPEVEVLHDGRVETNQFDEYGSQVWGYTNQFGFTDKELDIENKLQYFGARYLSNSYSRFYSIDPVLLNINSTAMYGKSLESILQNPQELNSYSYALNNPVNRVDPTGNTSLRAIWRSFIDKLWSFVSNTIHRSNNTSHSNTSTQSTQRSTTWDAITDQRIKSLDPRVQQPATNFINNVESRLGVQLRVTEGYRSNERQEQLYWQSRTNPPTGPWVTNARAGESYHNYGQAIDVVVMRDGQPVWEPISQEIANLGIEQGFEWGGNWSRPDYPHFEMKFDEEK